MNRKGFTLIELLAVVAILAVVGGIATASVISYIDNSKLKSEKIFVDKLSKLIDDYLDLKPQTISTTSYQFTKCKDSTCTNSYQASAYKTQATIHLNDLVIAGVVAADDLVNPKNKEKCLSGDGPEIVVYKDTDYVYHYYVDLSGDNTTCHISDENALINTLPDNLIEVLDQNVTLPDILKETITE